MKSSRLRSLISLVIVVALVGAFAHYLYVNADKYLQFLRLSVAGVISIFALCLLFPWLSGIMTTILFRGLGANLSFEDGFLLNSASTLANQLPISGGIIARGYYLKRKYSLSYAKFLSASVAIFLCFIGANGVIALAILLFVSVVQNVAVSPILIAGFGAMTACLLVFWLPVDRLKLPKRIHELLHQAIEGWILIGRNPALLFQLVGLQVLLLINVAIRYWLAFHMLSLNVTFGDAMLFSAATILTQLVSIAPGGLGIREGIVAAVAASLGFDTGASLLAGTLDRLVATIPILIIGGISTLVLAKQISDLPINADGHE